MMSVEKVQDAARRYIAIGIAVFPVAACCRVPMVKGGCHAATTDLERVPLLFTRSSNIALSCGPRSGVFVLDVDTKGADGLAALRALEQEHGPLPETWTAETPSAGAHLYFRHVEGRTLRNRVGFVPGLDVRTAGGSVALPPSSRSDGAYRWTRPPGSCDLADAPAWLLTLIDPPEPPRPPARPLRIDGSERAVRYVCKVVDQECGALSTMGPNTGRNLRLFQVSARLGELVGGNLLTLDAATQALERVAVECGLVREDGWHAVRATIRSGMTKGQANPQALEVSA